MHKVNDVDVVMFLMVLMLILMLMRVLTLILMLMLMLMLTLMMSFDQARLIAHRGESLLASASTLVVSIDIFEFEN